MMAAINSKQLAAPTVEVSLTEEQEDNMVCWLRRNSYLYEGPVPVDVFVQRQEAWKDQAQVIGISVSALYAWFQLQVNIYVSLCLRQKMDTTITASMRGRDAWVLANFNFLHKHVLGYEVPSTPKMPVLRPAP
jgi:hypothetical protein